MRPRSDTLLVWTGASCAYGCRTCPIDAAKAPAGIRLADLQQGLQRIPGREGRLVVLVGGEPFLRPDFLPLVATIRAAGCLPGVVTTGRPLVYPQIRAKLRRAALAYLRVQFFGIGEAHDRVAAVPGAFDLAARGLREWIAEDEGACDVDAALNVRRRPFDTIPSEVEALGREIASATPQIIVAIDAGDEPPPDDAARKVVAELAEWNDDPARPLLVWEGLPEAGAAPSCLEIAPPRPAFVAATTKACCLGAVASMARPADARRQETRANSFNYVSTAVVVPRTGDWGSCTAHETASSDRPERGVWLTEGEHLVLYATDTGDFDRDEIRRIKEEWSHLFLDRSPAGVLDDFVEGMRRLRPDPICEPCPHRDACSRRFHVVEGRPFAREEAWIADYVGSLRGRVLDVGCGEQLYRDRLEPLVRSESVVYTGLDPDERSIDALRAVLPQGRFYLGGIENFWAEPSSYDRILCLRSLNHVFDIDEALARMAALLKPQGQLLIVETTPFAMLRRPEQVAAADRAPRAGHQHFRNVTSTEVLPFARRRSLRVVEHHPAGLATTNEWILLLEKG
jgi:SAM-dependent methyltransferase